jgi:ribosomal protein L37E
MSRRVGYNSRRMPEPSKPSPQVPAVAKHGESDKVLCERCGAEMFRMHAVWRCPSCGFKTDCCGW